MRVLLLTQYFWPETFRINEVAESLQKAGCHVSVLTGKPNYPDGKVFSGYRALGTQRERHPASGCEVFRVPMFPRRAGKAWGLIANYLSFVVSASLFGSWLLRGRPYDIIFVYGISPILQAVPGTVLKVLKRAALVTWVQDQWPQSLEATGFVRNRYLLSTVAVIVRWIYRRSDLLLVQSRAFIEPVRAMARVTPVVYHPNPGELAFGSAMTDGEPALYLNAGFNVVFAGNLGTVQALDTILEAAEKTRSYGDIWWVVIGSGSRSEWLQNEVRQRGLAQVVLPGRFAPAAMPPILAQASALLVSLVRSPIMSQTVPSKIQAYLAAGRPIVAALDGEGARVINEAAAGVTCPAEDAEALANAVLQLHAMQPDELHRMGESGRCYYRRHFEPTLLAKQLIERFQEAVSR